MKKHKLIGELLVQSGVVRKWQVEEALELQKKLKKRLGEILIKLGYITPHMLSQKLCKQAGLRFMELRPKILDTELIRSFPYPFLYENNILPLYETSDNLHVVTGDPVNRKVINRLQEFTNKKIVLCGTEPIQIVKLLAKM